MKNGKVDNLEARLERLEADVKEIKAMLQAQQPEKLGWKAIVGSHANDPVFDEIVRLGAEIREKERRKARAKTGKSKVKS